MPTFDRALVRPTGPSFCDGLTCAGLGAPDVERALVQHRDYCDGLAAAGLSLVQLDADPRHPDSTFVEDTAVVTEKGVVLTRPGAPSRESEVVAIGGAFRRLGLDTVAIEPPGTVDGGDVCEAGGKFLIGLSQRTNRHGASQLAARLERWGYGVETISIRGLPGLLHLKSGLSDLGDGRLAAVVPLVGHPALLGFELVAVDPEEAYAANCIRVNDSVFVAAGHPRFEEKLDRLGYSTVALEMSEFRKMDGGLSCLSLRLPTGLIR
jgi:dimethylargininase